MLCCFLPFGCFVIHLSLLQFVQLKYCYHEDCGDNCGLEKADSHSHADCCCCPEAGSCRKPCNPVPLLEYCACSEEAYASNNPLHHPAAINAEACNSYYAEHGSAKADHHMRPQPGRHRDMLPFPAYQPADNNRNNKLENNLCLYHHYPHKTHFGL